MIITHIKKWLYILIIILVPIKSLAVVVSWQIIPAESSINFTATQNGAPVTGSFKTFSGEINFDPNQLNLSTIKIVIDIGSITDPYSQLADTLKEPDWFNTKLFPQAIFKSVEIVKIDNNNYQAKGLLTIRDKTVPITFKFTQEEYSQTKAKMKGSVMLKRLAFGVGQGEWADTKTVKDDVKIDFVISARKQP